MLQACDGKALANCHSRSPDAEFNLVFMPCRGIITRIIDRKALHELRSALDSFPVVALLGPRQVGKTTLALTHARDLGQEATRYLDLESIADRARLADPEAYLEAQLGRLVILDEIHRAPELFAVLRGTVDRRRRAGLRSGQFLVLGSASLELLRQSSESLAGRIAFVELTPIRVDELDRAAIEKLWLRGGFPDSLLAKDESSSLEWRRAFIRTYLERDIPQFGPDVLGHPVAGPSWEGMVLESAHAAAGRFPVSYFGTAAGAEIDMVIEGRRGRRLAVEIKRSSAPTVSRGFRSGLEDLDVHSSIVIYPGSEVFPLGSGTVAMGLHDALNWIREELSD